MERILAIGAHFDDVEIGIGGTLLKHIEKGDRVFLAVTDYGEFRTGDPKDRLNEQYNSLNKMNLDRTYLFLFEQNIKDEDSIINTLDQLNVNTIYVPYEKDTHQSHRRTSIIGQAIGRKKHITSFFYDCGSSYEFYPNLFSMINFEKKLELINCFKSQIKCGAINLDIVNKKESYFASLITDKLDQYAEGFIVRKMEYII